MARHKLERVPVEEIKEGDIVHFTAAGVPYMVTENSGKRIVARRVTPEHQATVVLPITGQMEVVRETPDHRF